MEQWSNELRIMLINAKVTPKAKLNKIKKISPTEYQIYTTSPPDKNKANQAVIKLLAQELKLPQSQIQIIQGHTSRNKLIEIQT